VLGKITGLSYQPIRIDCLPRHYFHGVCYRLDTLSAMRLATITAWLFVGFGLLMIGALLYLFQITEDGKLARFLGLLGVVYFGIGVVVTLVHDRHMLKRTQAGRE